MTKATVAKLFVLIFLAFIVCLPEFFPSEVLQVQFLCAHFDPCDPNTGHVYETHNKAALTLPRCEAKNATNQDEAVKQWFLCESHVDLLSLALNNTSDSKMDLEVMVTLQITALPLLQNVTVNGHLNHSGLHIDTQHNITLFGCCLQNESTELTPSSSSKPSPASHEPNISQPGIFSERSSDVTSSGGKTSSSKQKHKSNGSRCLYYFKDVQGVSSKAVRRWSVSTIVWLVLVLMVVILVLLGVRDQVFKNTRCCQKKVKPVQRPANQPKMFSKRRVKSLGDLPDDVSVISIEDKDLFLEKTLSDYSRGHVTSQRRHSFVSKTRLLQVFQESFNRGLSPIPELSVTDGSLGEHEDGNDEEARSEGAVTEEDFEWCLDDPQTPRNSDNFTFLHHRSLPSLESCH